MLEIAERLSGGGDHDDRLILPFERRRKSRMRVQLESGVESALFMERGTILRDGDRLRASDGRVVLVVAAEEPVMVVTADSPHQLMRAVYHLGNRHVSLQIEEHCLKLEQDHVLQEMLQGLGVTVTCLNAPFEPEAGAYGGGHRHHHDDDSTTLRPPLRLRLSHD